MSFRCLLFTIAIVAGGATAAVPPVRTERVTTTVYVGQHFEVRDHELPVKYAFHGGTRVARIIGAGSVASSARLQRLRLHSGWNSLALGVTATDLAGQLNRFTNGPAPLVQALYQWRPATRDYQTVGSGQTIPAGAVLWLRARTNVVAAVSGAAQEPAIPVLPPGGGYVGAPGVESWCPNIPAGATLWRYNATSGRWQATERNELGVLNDAPPELAPGDAVYIDTPEAVELEIPAPSRRVLFYHSDHLGSATSVTDANGTRVEATAYEPFGAVRRQESTAETRAYYGYNAKERDPESGLQYFGHRFLEPVLGRWLSADPLLERGGGQNAYAYAKQNPLKYQDPDGGEITVVKGSDKGITTYEIKMQAVLIDVSSSKFSQQQIAEYGQKLKASIEHSFQGQQGKSRWSAKVDIRVIQDYSQVGDGDHVIRIMDKTRDDAAGATVRGTKVLDIAAHTLKKPTPDQVDHSNPANKHYTWENYTSPEGTGTHEFGHSAGLPHAYGKTPNLMQPGDVRKSDNKDVTFEQILIMYKASSSGQLNQRDKVLDGITKRR